MSISDYAGKLYVHLNPDKCIIFKAIPSSRVCDIVTFVSSHYAVTDAIQILSPSGRIADGRRLLSGLFELQADVFVVVSKKRLGHTNAITEKSTSRVTKPKIKKQPSQAKLELTLNEKDTKQLALLLDTATKDQQRGLLGRARMAYESVLATLRANLQLDSKQLRASASRLSTDTLVVLEVSSRQLAAIRMENKLFLEAAGAFLDAFAYCDAVCHRKGAGFPSFGPHADVRVERVLMESLAGKAYLFGLKPSLSVTILESSLKNTKSLHQLLRTSDVKARVAVQDVENLLARALYQVPNDPEKRSRAIQLFEKVIQQDPTNASALAGYSKVAFDMGKGVEALPHMLRAVANQDPQAQDGAREAKKLLAATVGNHGVDVLVKELQAAADSPAALAFLAQTLKDEGEVKAACKLYYRAINGSSLSLVDRSNAVLNLVHCLEICNQYREAFVVLRTLMSSADESDSLTVTHPTSQHIVKLSDVHKLIGGVRDVTDVALSLGSCKDVPAYTTVVSLTDAGKSQVTIPGQSERQESTTLYSPLELNLLALMFTAVKILFVNGALQPLPALIALIEPLRDLQSLHLTTIRNEHAYYCCVAQVTAHVPFPIPRPVQRSQMKADAVSFSNEESKGNSDVRQVYVIGDSHCLSSAWQSVKSLDGKSTLLLTPRLVTGLKCWHLRPGATFYPKRNFEMAVASVPHGATVVFMFGEIDCRESLLASVARGLYVDIEAACVRVIEIYVKEIASVSKRRNFRAYVHPVPPVLPETREVVQIFSRVLAQHVTKQPSLVYLDFFDKLLQDGALKNAYKLDGTHMHPKYAQDLLSRTF